MNRSNVMGRFIERLMLVFTYGPELDEVLQDTRRKKQEEKWEADRHRLRLCEKHQQESTYSHYAPCNCHYCRLLEHLDKENAS